MDWSHSFLSKSMQEEEIIAAFKNIFSQVDTGGPLLFENAVSEFVDLVMSGTITVKSAVSILQFIDVANVDILRVALCDALWMWGTQTIDSSPRWTNLVALVKEIGNREDIIPSVQLKTALELNLLVASGIWKDEPAIQKRLVKINTGLIYKQQKYNLLREETEGYSKLGVILSTMPAPPLSPTSHIATVLSVIGLFDLEPNRVLDIILDVFQQQLWNPCFTTLCTHFRKSHIVHVVGNKFAAYQYVAPPPVADAAEAVTPTSAKKGAIAEPGANAEEKEIREHVVVPSAPKSLYQLAAVLVHENLVNLSDLLVYIGSNTTAATCLASTAASNVKPAAAADGSADPKLVSLVDEMVSQAKNKEQATRADLKTVGVVKLGSSANSSSLTRSATDDKSATLPANARAVAATALASSSSSSAIASSSAAALSSLVASKQQSKSGFTTTPGVVSSKNGVVTVAQSALPDKVTPYCEGNQLMGLLAAFFSIHSWKHAVELMKITLLPSTASVSEEAKAPICHELNNLFVPATDPLSLLATSKLTLLSTLSPSLMLDPMLFSDVRVELCSYLLWLVEKPLASGKSIIKPKFPGLNVKSKAADKDRHESMCSIVGPDKYVEMVADNVAYVAVIDHSNQFLSVVDLADGSSQLSCMLSLLRHFIGYNSTLYNKVISLLQSLIGQSSSSDEGCGVTSVMIVAQWMVGHYLLPALTVSHCNPANATVLWSCVLKNMPFHTRFQTYEMWRAKSTETSKTGSFVNLLGAEIKALHGAKGVLKRLAKETVKLVGRQLVKISHQCPLIVFNQVLGQIEFFDNLIPFVVDALKYNTDLSRDCMAFTLLNQLGKDSNKMKPGDTHCSQWFGSLTKFIGTFYRKYPTTEIKGLLHYLMKKLSIGESLDILVLKEVLSKMGGCETTLDVSLQQLDGLSGGKVLRTEILSASTTGGAGMAVGATSAVVSREVVNKKAIRILREELFASETALPLLLFIAQNRSRIAYIDAGESGNGSNASLKLISHLYDTCQDVLMQFTEFLMAGSTAVNDSSASGSAGDAPFDTILAIMPSMSTLLGPEIGLSIPVAFQLVRPLMRASLISSFATEAKEAEARKSAEASMDVEGAVVAAPSSKQPLSVSAIILRKWNPFGPEILDAIRQYHPQSLWDTISPELYITFWSLSLYDLKVPASKYEAEIKRLRSRDAQLNSKLNDISNMTFGSLVATEENNQMKKTIKTEMRKVSNSLNDLVAEFEVHEKHVTMIHKLIAGHKDTYLSHVKPELFPKISESIVQYCVHDRVLMSPVDATFCSQFFMLVHKMETPAFSTIHFLDKSFKMVAPLIYCCTDYEVSFVGFVLVDLLTYANRWMNDRRVFMAEAGSKRGFSVSFRGSTSTSTNTSAVKDKEEVKKTSGEAPSSSGKPAKAAKKAVDDVKVTFLQYGNIYKIWHQRLRSILVSCLKSTDYMQIRSALVLVSKLDPYFPTRATAGRELQEIVAQTEKEETKKKREDLRLMAKSIGTILKRQSAKWFEDGTPPPAPAGSSGGSAKSAQPHRQPASSSHPPPASTSRRDSLPPSRASHGSQGSSASAGGGNRQLHAHALVESKLHKASVPEVEEGHIIDDEEENKLRQRLLSQSASRQPKSNNMPLHSSGREGGKGSHPMDSNSRADNRMDSRSDRDRNNQQSFPHMAPDSAASGGRDRSSSGAGGPKKRDRSPPISGPNVPNVTNAPPHKVAAIGRASSGGNVQSAGRAQQQQPSGSLKRGVDSQGNSGSSGGVNRSSGSGVGHDLPGPSVAHKRFKGDSSASTASNRPPVSTASQETISHVGLSMDEKELEKIRRDAVNSRQQAGRSNAPAAKGNGGRSGPVPAGGNKPTPTPIISGKSGQGQAAQGNNHGASGLQGAAGDGRHERSGGLNNGNGGQQQAAKHQSQGLTARHRNQGNQGQGDRNQGQGDNSQNQGGQNFNNSGNNGNNRKR